MNMAYPLIIDRYHDRWSRAAMWVFLGIGGCCWASEEVPAIFGVLAPLFLSGAAPEDVPPPALVSTVKLRQAGFCEAMETEETLRCWLRKLIERRILPPP